MISVIRTRFQQYTGPVPNPLRASDQYYERPGMKTSNDYGSFSSPSKNDLDPYGPRDSRQSDVYALENKIRDLEQQYSVSTCALLSL